MSINGSTTALVQEPAEAAPARPAALLPSVHVRAAATWLVIFPLVAVGMTALGLVAGDWHPVLRALVLTAVVVPLAVYVLVPRVLGLYARHIAPRLRQP
ncbi:hypothetical protein [Arthrobacter sp. 35W]|uniref:hypothetical protein n=1 Tax=Arthrobacter sp. 35W TaxID=1132441 RepID=UPI000554A87F|nr:hypothetical protein [Arthrobacter sp. 35W]